MASKSSYWVSKVSCQKSYNYINIGCLVLYFGLNTHKNTHTEICPTVTWTIIMAAPIDSHLQYNILFIKIIRRNTNNYLHLLRFGTAIVPRIEGRECMGGRGQKEWESSIFTGGKGGHCYYVMVRRDIPLAYPILIYWVFKPFKLALVILPA